MHTDHELTSNELDADSELDAVTGGDLSALPKLISGVQRLLDTTTTAIIRNIVHIRECWRKSPRCWIGQDHEQDQRHFEPRNQKNDQRL
jgi:hypothetical protein